MIYYCTLPSSEFYYIELDKTAIEDEGIVYEIILYHSIDISVRESYGWAYKNLSRPAT